MAQPRIPQRFLPFMQQAQAEANVRYGPQVSALAELLSQASGQYRQSLAQANAARQIIQAATQRAQGQLADPSNPITSLALKAQGLPGSEGAIVAQNLGLTANAARSDLAQHYVQAADAQKYQGQAALNAYQSDAGKIGQQQLDLQGQYGNYITGRYDSQVTADRKQRHDANVAARQLAAGFVKAGVTPSGQVIKGGPKDPAIVRAGHPPRPASSRSSSSAAGGAAPKLSLLPKTGQVKQVGAIQGAFANVKQLMAHPKAVRSEVATLLRAGKVDGVKYTQPQIDIAFDLFKNGGALSGYGVRRAHQIGVQVNGNFKVVKAPKYVPPNMSASGPVGA